MRRRAGPSLPLLAALLAAAAVCAAAVPQVSPVMAIDLGAEFLKLSIVKPGRIPISVVINEMSKRKTPALVAFVDGDRLVGEEAAAVAARFPDRVYGRLLDLLGRPADNPQLTAMLKASYRPYALERAPNRTSPAAAAVRTGDELRSAEELVASLLEYAKGLAEAAADGAAVTDAVLTVPASFTIQQVCTAGVGVGEGWAGAVWWRCIVGYDYARLAAGGPEDGCSCHYFPASAAACCGSRRNRCCCAAVLLQYHCLSLHDITTCALQAALLAVSRGAALATALTSRLLDAPPSPAAAPGAARCRQAGGPQRAGPHPQPCRCRGEWQWRAGMMQQLPGAWPRRCSLLTC